MRNLAIVSFSPVARDPRVTRQIEALKDNYNLTVIGFGAVPDCKEISFVPIDPGVSKSVARKLHWALDLFGRRFESYYWHLPWVIQTRHVLAQISPDGVIANDVDALPVSLSIGAPVLCDAHEYAPRQFEDSLRWRIFFQKYKDHLCKTYLPRASAMTTVCAGISEEYRRCYGVSSRVVHNSPLWQCPVFRAVKADRINIIHHGVASRSRHLEQMIDMVAHLDDKFHLDMMLVGEGLYLEELKKRAESNQRIRFLPPVPLADICTTLSRYDIGLYLLKPVNFNYMHSLPNKFFEFVQAGLAVAIGPSPEMKSIADKYGFGVISDVFEPKELAKKLNELLVGDINRLKAASVVASRELAFEADAQIIREEVNRIVALR